MATDVYSCNLKDTDGDGNVPTTDVSGTAVSAVVVQRGDGNDELTITITT